MRSRQKSILLVLLLVAQSWLVIQVQPTTSAEGEGDGAGNPLRVRSAMTEFRWQPTDGQSQPSNVSLVGEWNWSAPVVMVVNATAGIWLAEMNLAEGLYCYKFLLNGTDYIFDASNPERIYCDGMENSLARVKNHTRSTFSLELDMLYGGQVQVKRMSSPLLQITTDEDAKAIYDAFEEEFSAAFSPLVVNKPGGVFLDNFVLRATVPTKKAELPTYELVGTDSSEARIGQRAAFWRELGEEIATDVYQFEALQPGNRLEGPAIVEAELTTVVVPPGMTFSVDKHGLGIMEGGEVAKRSYERRAKLVVEPAE